ncbi:hypothetical protein D3C81_1695800 [compost metagenome]
MQVQHITIMHLDVGPYIEVAAVLAVGNTEQIRGRMRVFDIHRAIAELAVQFEGIGIGAQSIRGIEIVQAAHVIGKILADLATLAAVHIPFQVGIAAAVLDPFDARQPGTHVQTRRIVGIVGTAADGRFQAALRDAAVAVVAGQRHVVTHHVIRYGLGCSRRRHCILGHGATAQGGHGQRQRCS